MSFAQAENSMWFGPGSRVESSFPSAQLRFNDAQLPVEVSLIAQLGHGAGNQLCAGVQERQSKHRHFIDALEEPSARIGDANFSKGDATSLYMFSVGENGHPFHRHAGHRVFTAVSGSGGARLRFASATDEQLERDPASFIAAMRSVEIPPDCLFTVRFGGGIWHQFTPLKERSAHPALFAVSCHTNELGGALSDAQRSQVVSSEASIPSLTELLPERVVAFLRGTSLERSRVPTIVLSLDAPKGSVHARLCSAVRASAGWLRGHLSRCRRSIGYFWDSGLTVEHLAHMPPNSLLREQLDDGPIHHEDTFRLSVIDGALARQGSHALLAALLQSFVECPPDSVSQLMALRNALVKPMGLRTSPLGCPVSSLLSPCGESVFAGRFPVKGQCAGRFGDSHEVVLGANDKHLVFRSCVGVTVTGDRVDFTLGSRVRCTNRFGHVYMRLIDSAHRRHVAPTLLRHAVQNLRRTQPPA
ncbi:DUF2867 domain-containing protein [Dyella sp. 2HG41-7]|uniref:DUF2867 domain-containing protein n=1 Tax=Dyella sp. 2HG41-7 TaxID=2883239 RepID=UPI001F2EBDB5|nr:DUF2867 domain-containing protein [Dyella sp. 2HG41-7]